MTTMAALTMVSSMILAIVVRYVLGLDLQYTPIVRSPRSKSCIAKITLVKRGATMYVQ
jgi:hypothetical protein